jgi:hypothetical protein
MLDFVMGKSDLAIKLNLAMIILDVVMIANIQIGQVVERQSKTIRKILHCD